MKIKYKETIDGFAVVRLVAEAIVDSEMTKARIDGLITPGMSGEDIERRYAEHAVYANTGPEAELIDDAEGEALLRKLGGMGKNQLLLETGEYLDDYRGVEYWIHKSGRWKQETVGEAGVSLPAGAVQQEELSPAQRGEIAAQKEAGRIAALSAGERAAEKESRLRDLAREANRKTEDAELLGEAFDKQAFFAAGKAEIEKRYA